MKMKIVSIFATAVLILALTFPASAPAAPPNAKPVPATAQPAVPERHPEIHDALEALRRARAHMDLSLIHICTSNRRRGNAAIAGK